MCSKRFKDRHPDSSKLIQRHGEDGAQQSTMASEIRIVRFHYAMAKF